MNLLISSSVLGLSTPRVYLGKKMISQISICLNLHFSLLVLNINEGIFLDFFFS